MISNKGIRRRSGAQSDLKRMQRGFGHLDRMTVYRTRERRGNVVEVDQLELGWLE